MIKLNQPQFAALLICMLVILPAATVMAQEEDGHSHGGETVDVELGADIQTAWGASSADEETLAELQGGGHDPSEEGFNLQSLEVWLGGNAAENLRGDLAIAYHAGESEFELEEAYLTYIPTSAARIKAGYFYPAFGLLNDVHNHEWAWLDRPIASVNLLGGEGVRGPGVQLQYSFNDPCTDSWLTRFSLGLHAADDDTMGSFLGQGHHHDHGEEDEHEDEGEEHEHEHEHEFDPATIGGRPAVEEGGSGDYLVSARLAQRFTHNCETASTLGASGMWGSNATGGQTTIWGLDYTLAWQDACTSWRFAKWQTEYINRHYEADAYYDDSDADEIIDLPGETFNDSGYYTQVIAGVAERWQLGLRYEDCRAGGGESIGGKAADPERAARTRLSPLLVYDLGPGSRLRAQYNHDEADWLDGGEDTIWLNWQLTFGGHNHADSTGAHGHEHDHEHGDEHDDHEHDHGDEHAGHSHDEVETTDWTLHEPE